MSLYKRLHTLFVVPYSVCVYVYMQEGRGKVGGKVTRATR